MEKHTCKLCFRHFSNGRALGGHMRSHVVAAAAASAAAAAAASAKSLLSDDYYSSTSEAEEAAAMGAEGKGLCYGLRENPRKSFRLVDPECSSNFAVAAAVDAGSSVVQDRESETESSPKILVAAAAAAVIHHRRSKRTRRSPAAPPPPELPEPEPLSSVSDTTPEEDVALSLIMMSRDVWDRHEEEAEEEMKREELLAGKPRPAPTRGRSRFQCGTCKRVFRSYQALGGHRASHKKTRNCAPPKADAQIHDAESSEANATAAADRSRSIHECSICFRVFDSGHALGGHKRSHFLSSPIANSSVPPPPPPSTNSPAAAKLNESLFDLNLPAPMDDAAELSDVSEAAESTRSQFQLPHQR